MLLLKRIMMKRQIKNKCPWRTVLYSCEAQTQDPDKSELNFETKKKSLKITYQLHMTRRTFLDKV